MVMLSTLSPSGTFVAETSSWPWILVFAVMAIGAIVAWTSLKKT